MKVYVRRIRLDCVLDYIPIVSAINNLIVLIQKRIFSQIPLASVSPYQSYIQEKRSKACIIYSIPFGKLIYKLLGAYSHPEKNKVTEPFYNIQLRVMHAYRMRNASEISQDQYDKIVSANFSKMLRMNLDPEHYLHEGFETCITFMGSSTKPYALIAHALFFGWNENEDFVRLAAQQFARYHCKNFHRENFEESVNDFTEFLNVLTPEMQELALEQFSEKQLEKIGPFLAEILAKLF